MNSPTTPKSSSRSAFPAVPLLFARSGLFGGGAPPANHCVEVQDPRGGGLFYEGPRLTQYHALAWQAVIQSAQLRRVGSGQWFTVSADSLLIATGGQGRDTEQRARLWRRLDELTHGQVGVVGQTRNYTGALVLGIARDVKTKQFSIMLKPGLGALLTDEVLRNDLARKSALGRNLLAMWLHDYFASHLRPQPEGMARLRDVCGSRLALPQFRQRLRAAMVLLSKGETPLVVSWSIDGRDRLVVTKSATRVVILKPETVEAKQRGIRSQARKDEDIRKARAQRAGVRQ